MTLHNRKTPRAALAAAITTNITQLQSVFKSLPKKPAGVSPFCTVESGPATYQFSPDENKFGFVVGMWVLRDDADAAEDLLDDLAQDLAQVVDTWHTATFSQESQTDYAMLDGKYDYRVEWHFVTVEWE